MKTTRVPPEAAQEHMGRSGFVPVCEYGHGMEPIQDGEIGSICGFSRQSHMDNGIVVTTVTQLERIVVNGSRFVNPA